jgi:hypothetical protein
LMGRRSYLDRCEDGVGFADDADDD